MRERGLWPLAWRTCSMIQSRGCFDPTPARAWPAGPRRQRRGRFTEPYGRDTRRVRPGRHSRPRRHAEHHVEAGRQLADARLLERREIHGDGRAGLGVFHAQVDEVAVVARLALDVAL